MRITIDDSMKVLQEVPKVMPITKESINVALDIMRKYQQLQADYESRLKADLKAILVDLQLDVEEQKFDTHIDKDVWNDAVRVCSDIIQQKINKLKSESEE